MSNFIATDNPGGGFMPSPANPPINVPHADEIDVWSLCDPPVLPTSGIDPPWNTDASIGA